MRRLSAPLLLIVCAAVVLRAQTPPPVRIFQPPQPEAPKPQQQPPATPAQPGAPGQTTPQPTTQPAQPLRLAANGALMMDNVSLVEMIKILAEMMKINYILDPRVKGAVTVRTYGEVRPVDLMPFMQTILRVNGAAMVQVGEFITSSPSTAWATFPSIPPSTQNRGPFPMMSA
jgi:hypothetical protein